MQSLVRLLAVLNRPSLKVPPQVPPQVPLQVPLQVRSLFPHQSFGSKRVASILISMTWYKPRNQNDKIVYRLVPHWAGHSRRNLGRHETWNSIRVSQRHKPYGSVSRSINPLSLFLKLRRINPTLLMEFLLLRSRITGNGNRFRFL